jgi:hypothetical protein
VILAGVADREAGNPDRDQPRLPLQLRGWILERLPDVVDPVAFQFQDFGFGAGLGLFLRGSFGLLCH